MLKPSWHQLVQHRLPRVAKGSVAQVVAQSDGFCEILVKPQTPSDGAGDLADLQGMGQAGAVMIPHRGKEHLGLMLEPAEGFTVDNPIPIPHERGPHRAIF